MIKKEHLEYALRQEDEEYANHTFKTERELLEGIKSGDVDDVRKRCEKLFPAYPQLIQSSEKKNEEYMAVITISLVARAVIETGVSSMDSFQLSDIYLQKIASLNRVEDIIATRNDALVAFTSLVNKKNTYKKANIYIEECKNYISSNIFKKIKAEDISKALNVNYIYLERIFNREEKMTIMRYIQKEKMERAKNLLIYSNKSILEIGNYLGYTSQSHFGKIFKRETGMTPKRYRQTHYLSEF